MERESETEREHCMRQKIHRHRNIKYMQTTCQQIQEYIHTTQREREKDTHRLKEKHT